MKRANKLALKPLTVGVLEAKHLREVRGGTGGYTIWCQSNDDCDESGQCDGQGTAQFSRPC